jgi:hypothetical protein
MEDLGVVQEANEFRLFFKSEERHQQRWLMVLVLE